jgi:carbamoyltransferase
MNLVHSILPPYRAALVALTHPDQSTRAQTIERLDDPYLYDVLHEFELLAGFPMLVNTSMNGPGEPIAETPKDALEFFTSHPEVDALLIEDLLIRRDGNARSKYARLAPDTVVTIVYPLGKKRVILIRRDVALEVSPEALDVVDRQSKNRRGDQRLHELPVAAHVETELTEAVRRGLLVF